MQKAWKSCTELKQELENKVWQKDCDVFDRIQNKSDDVFGTLIKQIEKNRKSKKPHASPKKCDKRMQEKYQEPSTDEIDSTSESQEKLQNKSSKNENSHDRPDRITKKHLEERTISPTECSENIQQVNLNKKSLQIRLKRLTNEEINNNKENDVITNKQCNNLSETEQNKIPSEGENKEHSCELCAKKYKSPTALRTHVRTFH